MFVRGVLNGFCVNIYTYNDRINKRKPTSYEVRTERRLKAPTTPQQIELTANATTASSTKETKTKANASKKRKKTTGKKGTVAKKR